MYKIFVKRFVLLYLFMKKAIILKIHNLNVEHFPLYDLYCFQSYRYKTSILELIKQNQFNFLIKYWQIGKHLIYLWVIALRLLIFNIKPMLRFLLRFLRHCWCPVLSYETYFRTKYSSKFSISMCQTSRFF